MAKLFQRLGKNALIVYWIAQMVNCAKINFQKIRTTLLHNKPSSQPTFPGPALQCATASPVYSHVAAAFRIISDGTRSEPPQIVHTFLLEAAEPIHLHHLPSPLFVLVVESRVDERVPHAATGIVEQHQPSTAKPADERCRYGYFMCSLMR